MPDSHPKTFSNFAAISGVTYCISESVFFPVTFRILQPGQYPESEHIILHCFHCPRTNTHTLSLQLNPECENFLGIVTGKVNSAK